MDSLEPLAIYGNAELSTVESGARSSPALWRDQFRDGVVVVISSNYALHGDLSRCVMETLAGFTNCLEIYSIDEAFLVVEDWFAAQLEGFAREIRQRVNSWTGIPAGVGIWATKVLAKLANRAAKKSGGMCVLNHRQLWEAIATHATMGGEKLCQQKLAAGLCAFLCTNPHRADLPK